LGKKKDKCPAPLSSINDFFPQGPLGRYPQTSTSLKNFPNTKFLGNCPDDFLGNCPDD